MKNNIVKNILKVMATAAIAATLFIGSGKEAKACEMCDRYEVGVKTLSQKYGISEDDVWIYHSKELDQLVLTEEELAADTIATEQLVNFVNGAGYEMIAVRHKDMLAKVNADRKANGSGNLVWDADLEAIANRRAVEIMANAQTKEYVDALNAGDYATQAALIHNGSAKEATENAHVAYFTGMSSKKANSAWIASAGHHEVRINASFTKYACASYTDPVTNMETWVEVFADNSFKGAASFDYIRYAKDYPDLAAAFGQDKDALYKHYRTYGRNEGRKAYNTDGTLIK